MLNNNIETNKGGMRIIYRPEVGEGDRTKGGEVVTIAADRLSYVVKGKYFNERILTIEKEAWTLVIANWKSKDGGEEVGISFLTSSKRHR